MLVQYLQQHVLIITGIYSALILLAVISCKDRGLCCPLPLLGAAVRAHQTTVSSVSCTPENL